MTNTAVAQEIANFLYTIATVHIVDSQKALGHMLKKLPEATHRLGSVLTEMNRMASKAQDLREKKILRNAMRRLAKNRIGSGRIDDAGSGVIKLPLLSVNLLLHWISAVVCVSISGGIAFGVLRLWSTGITVTVDDDPDGLFLNSRATSRARSLSKAKQSPNAKGVKPDRHDEFQARYAGTIAGTYQRRMSYPPFKEENNTWIEDNDGSRADDGVQGDGAEGQDREWATESEGEGSRPVSSFQVASPPFEKQLHLPPRATNSVGRLNFSSEWEGEEEAAAADQQAVQRVEERL
jgi:hypothetical protein